MCGGLAHLFDRYIIVIVDLLKCVQSAVSSIILYHHSAKVGVMRAVLS